MLDKLEKRYHSNQITERFFFAMDRILMMRKNGKISAKMFGETVGITSSNLHRIRTNPDENFVTVEAIGRLCNYWKISANWLITGNGQPFGENELVERIHGLEQRVGNLEEDRNRMETEIETLVKTLKR